MLRKDVWITATPADLPLVLSRHGAAFGLAGFVHGSQARLRALGLRLRQGDVCVAARHVSLQAGLLCAAGSDPGAVSGDRLDGGFYVSAVFPWAAGLRPGPAAVEADATWDDAATSTLRLTTVEILPVDPVEPGAALPPGCVGISMATYEPDPLLFARQIASIRAQSHADWVCVISDDGSRPGHRRAIAQAIAGDARFHLLPPGPRLGFYRNFERACAALPRACALVAFSDQDDVWGPDRLARQARALATEGGLCSYTDMRVIDPEGRVLSDTFWVHRKARYGSLSGLLLGNVVTGMTILADRGLIAQALPFPATPSLTYHDHWIALLAARLGGLRYLPEALASYVQHGANHTGALTAPPTTRRVLAQGLGRIARFVRRGIIGRRPAQALAEPRVLDWATHEPARLRILVARLDAEAPRTQDAALARLARRFGPLALARCGAAWGDRYRRAYAVELGLGALLAVLATRPIRRRRAHAEPQRS